jgi:hypothetical protein
MGGPGSANGYGSYAAALYFVFESIVKTSHYLVDFYERYLFAHQATEAFQKRDGFENLQRLEAVVKNSHIRDTFATNISGQQFLKKSTSVHTGPKHRAAGAGWMCSR